MHKFLRDSEWIKRAVKGIEDTIDTSVLPRTGEHITPGGFHEFFEINRYNSVATIAEYLPEDEDRAACVVVAAIIQFGDGEDISATISFSCTDNIMWHVNYFIRRPDALGNQDAKEVASLLGLVLDEESLPMSKAKALAKLRRAVLFLREKTPDQRSGRYVS